MIESTVTELSTGQAESKPFKHVLSRPDWPTKHLKEPKARNLLPYILEPEKHPDRVISFTADTVLIQDKYPKGQVHLLLLPRWHPHHDQHPHDSFEDPEFLKMMRAEAAEGLKVAIPMLKDKMYQSLEEGGLQSHQIDTLLSKRDFTKDFQIGIHAHPSQHDLHVHIKSRDMVSWHPYGSRHYQAFNTPFLVSLDLYPLPEKDIMREVQYQNDNLMKEDYQCWRCGKDFGTSWEDGMRPHLLEEWQAWIREG